MTGCGSCISVHARSVLVVARVLVLRAREGALVLVSWEWGVESMSARAVDMHETGEGKGRALVLGERSRDERSWS